MTFTDTTPIKPKRRTGLKILGAILFPPLGFWFLFKSSRPKSARVAWAIVLAFYAVAYLAVAVAPAKPVQTTPTAATVSATPSATVPTSASATATVSPSPSVSADPVAAAANGKAWGDAYARLPKVRTPFDPASAGKSAQAACQGAADQGDNPVSNGTGMPHTDVHGASAAWLSACVAAELAAEQELAPTPTPTPAAPTTDPTPAYTPAPAQTTPAYTPEPTHTDPPQPAPTTHQAAGCTLTSTGKCIQRGWYCPKPGGETGTDANGTVLTCEDKNGLRWE